MKHRIKFDKIKAFCALLSKGRKGGEALLFVLGMLEMAGALHAFYGFLPLWFLLACSILLAVLTPLVLYLGMLLLFGTRRLVRVLYTLDLAGMLVFLLGATQGRQIPFHIIYAVLFVSTLDLFGRAFYSFVIEKNQKKSLVITASVSLFLLLAAVFFLIPDGFANGNVSKYASMQDRAKEAPEGFADSVAAGSHEVASVSYGVGDGFDLQSETYDLSAFETRGFVNRLVLKLRFDTDVDETPLSGKIWYPKDLEHCPVLFIVHGNHDVGEESYLGYAYIGEYLASSGYAVVSVDENYCNSLSKENDARAILLLENVRKILKWNEDQNSPLYGKLDPQNIALAGHSRGGECVSIAALFNRYSRYPDNGNIRFDYDFSIRSLIAIAPTTDQYMPASQYVELNDISYLLIHGSNDQDVSNVMGEKQYDHINLNGGSNAFCSQLYVVGANHGQFNTRWGRYDYPAPESRMLDVHDLIGPEAQREILCTFLKTYLDVTLLGDDTYRSLFYDTKSYLSALPDTAYVQTYRDATFLCVFDFDKPAELGSANGGALGLEVAGAKEWTTKRRKTSSDAAGENYALAFHWGDDEKDEESKQESAQEHSVVIKTGRWDLGDRVFSFNLADMREKGKIEEAGPLSVRVILSDDNGKTAVWENDTVLPTVCVQLYKADALLHGYEYKHPFTTIRLGMEDCKADEGFDDAKITEVRIVFPDEKGDIEIDDIGIADQ